MQQEWAGRHSGVGWKAIARASPNWGWHQALRCFLQRRLIGFANNTASICDARGFNTSTLSTHEKGTQGLGLLLYYYELHSLIIIYNILHLHFSQNSVLNLLNCWFYFVLVHAIGFCSRLESKTAWSQTALERNCLKFCVVPPAREAQKWHDAQTPSKTPLICPRIDFLPFGGLSRPRQRNAPRGALNAKLKFLKF